MNEKQIQRMKEIMDSMDKGVVKTEELSSVMQTLILVIKNLKEQVDSQINSVGQISNASTDSLRFLINENDKKLRTLINSTITTIGSKIDNLDTKLSTEVSNIRSMIPIVPDLSKIEDKIFELQQKETILDTPEQVRDKLEVLRGNERLDKSAIKGLDEKLASLETSRGITLFGGAKKNNTVAKFSLSSQCNGSNKDFTLPIGTTEVLGLFGTQFPVQYDTSGDWTFSGRTLTLGASVGAPQTGQTLWALIVTL